MEAIDRPTYRVGLVGTGWLGSRLGERIAARPDADVAALAEIDDQTRTQVGADLGVPAESRFADPAEMLTRADLDAAVVVTPHALHSQHVTTALENDLHVLCEKPLATSLDDARELVRRAEASDRVVMVGYQRHLEPAFRAAREVWQRPDREPATVSASITQGWIARREEAGIGHWRLDPALGGGGFLYDTGNHLIDAVLWTTGLEPTGVSAAMGFYDEGIDVRASLTVDFANGAVAGLTFYGDAPVVREHLDTWGGAGATSIAGRGWNDRTIAILEADGTERRPHIEQGRDGSPFVAGKIEAFRDAIAGDAPPPATAMDGLRATAVTEAAYESAERGQRVAIDL